MGQQMIMEEEMMEGIQETVEAGEETVEDGEEMAEVETVVAEEIVEVVEIEIINLYIYHLIFKIIKF